MTNEEIKAQQLVKMVFGLPNYNNEIISMLTAKQLTIKMIDEILANIDATILYHKESNMWPINRGYWVNVRDAIK